MMIGGATNEKSYTTSGILTNNHSGNIYKKLTWGSQHCGRQ
jgi:hypothetical protein